MQKSAILAFAIVAATSLGCPAFAAEAGVPSSSDDAVNGAKISIVDAIRAAQEQVDGKTASAEIRQDGSKIFYLVEILTPAGGREDVAVDAATGIVTQMEAKDNDGDGDEDLPQ